MFEMIGAGRVRAGLNDHGFDAIARGLERHYFGQNVAGRLRCRIGAGEGVRQAIDPAAGIDQQALSRSPHRRKNRAVHPHPANGVQVDHLGPERFGQAVHHHRRVVHRDVDATMLGKDQVHRSACARLRTDVEFDRVERDTVIARDLAQLVGLPCRMVGNIAHRGVDDMACARELKCREATKARSGAGDQDDVLLAHATIPPLTRMT